VQSTQEKLVVFAVEALDPVTRNRTAPQKQVRPPTTITARTIERGRMPLKMAVNGMKRMVAAMPVIMLMSTTLMRMRHVASVAEGLIRHAPTIQRGRIPLKMAVNGMKRMGAPLPVIMLMSATLMRMRHVASVMEAFSLEKTNRRVRDVV
jgi:hypothetical protein